MEKITKRKNHMKFIQRIIKQKNGLDFLKDWSENRANKGLSKEQLERKQENKKFMIEYAHKIQADLVKQGEEIKANKIKRFEKEMRKFEGKPVYDPEFKNDDGTFGKTYIFSITEK